MRITILLLITLIALLSLFGCKIYQSRYNYQSDTYYYNTINIIPNTETNPHAEKGYYLDGEI